MRFHILSLFPEFFTSPLQTTMLQKGRERGALEFILHNIRDFATDKHQVTDDAPYGGGHGMVMKPEPVVAALESLAALRPWEGRSTSSAPPRWQPVPTLPWSAGATKGSTRASWPGSTKSCRWAISSFPAVRRPRWSWATP